MDRPSVFGLGAVSLPVERGLGLPLTYLRSPTLGCDCADTTDPIAPAEVQVCVGQGQVMSLSADIHQVRHGQSFGR